MEVAKAGAVFQHLEHNFKEAQFPMVGIVLGGLQHTFIPPTQIQDGNLAGGKFLVFFLRWLTSSFFKQADNFLYFAG